MQSPAAQTQLSKSSQKYKTFSALQKEADADTLRIKFYKGNKNKEEEI